MINLISTSLRFTVLILSGFYSFSRLAQTKLKLIDLLFIPASIAISVALYYVSLYAGIVPPVFILIAIALFSLRFKRPLYQTAVISIIAYAIVILVTVVCVIIAMILFIPGYVFLETAVQNLVEQSITSALQIVFSILLFKIRRLKSGLLRSVRNNTSLDRLAFAGIIVIFAFTLSHATKTRNVIMALCFVFIVFCCLTLAVLWRGHISQQYRDRISQRNVEILEKRISDVEAERAQLLEENGRLAKIIHRDNKLLPAMEIAVKHVCESYTADEQAKNLLENLTALYDERMGAVENFEREANALQRTDVISIDAVIGYLYGKAKENGTEFIFESTDGAVNAVACAPKDNMDLITLLCDLGENALIAVRKISGGKVKIVFENSDELACVSVYDNGAQFDENVIARMGLNKITTHKDEGGSGVGLVNTFELLRKNGASFIIDELVIAENYTKSVAVVFDGKYSHKVYSKRESIKKLCSFRNDLQVLEK